MAVLSLHESDCVPQAAVPGSGSVCKEDDHLCLDFDLDFDLDFELDFDPDHMPDLLVDLDNCPVMTLTAWMTSQSPFDGKKAAY